LAQPFILKCSGLLGWIAEIPNMMWMVFKDDHLPGLIWGMTPSQLGFTSGGGASSLQPQKPGLDALAWANKITLLMTKIFQAVKTVDQTVL